jgi:1,5-anhydro-D-fructose reductase (1,5-anhydro-D-mannitol-forming)
MVRYGILGFGHHAAKRLVPAFAATKDSTLVGLWRRDPAKARANAQEFGIAHAFETAEALCSSREVDAVFVASPDALHLHDVLLALQHGKPVLCEKPLAMSVEEVKTMLAAQAVAGVAFGVAQNMRFNQSLQLMRQWIGEGRIGQPVLSHSQFCYTATNSPRQWIYDPTLALGGPIGDVAIHCIDALRFVTNSDVAEVTTLAHTDAASGAVESHAVVALNFTSGAMGSVTVTTRGDYRSYLEVTGESGVLVCENGLTVDHDVTVIHLRGGQIVEQVPVSNADAYTRMLDSFSAEIQSTGTYLAPGTDGLHNQRILDAAYASWRNGMRQLVL